uniref:Uncharacterized protein n=1 Tax=Grammatophora oceanica TaxID=210454 RepID=A0A6U5Q4T0_9STRA|mmetsp:Transcript_9858/g.14479  ORF Transcript_9858/g.14479 Transcript_9858/m.14479 type:complete len:618 (+) Transcript_9858:181-2034(+)
MPLWSGSGSEPRDDKGTRPDPLAKSGHSLHQGATTTSQTSSCYVKDEIKTLDRLKMVLGCIRSNDIRELTVTFGTSDPFRVFEQRYSLSIRRFKPTGIKKEEEEDVFESPSPLVINLDIRQSDALSDFCVDLGKVLASGANRLKNLKFTLFIQLRENEGTMPFLENLTRVEMSMSSLFLGVPDDMIPRHPELLSCLGKIELEKMDILAAETHVDVISGEIASGPRFAIDELFRRCTKLKHLSVSGLGVCSKSLARGVERSAALESILVHKVVIDDDDDDADEARIFATHPSVSGCQFKEVEAPRCFWKTYFDELAALAENSPLRLLYMQRCPQSTVDLSDLLANYLAKDPPLMDVICCDTMSSDSSRLMSKALERNTHLQDVILELSEFNQTGTVELVGALQNNNSIRQFSIHVAMSDCLISNLLHTANRIEVRRTMEAAVEAGMAAALGAESRGRMGDNFNMSNITINFDAFDRIHEECAELVEMHWSGVELAATYLKDNKTLEQFKVFFLPLNNNQEKALNFSNGTFFKNFCGIRDDSTSVESIDETVGRLECYLKCNAAGRELMCDERIPDSLCSNMVAKVADDSSAVHELLKIRPTMIASSKEYQDNTSCEGI